MHTRFTCLIFLSFALVGCNSGRPANQQVSHDRRDDLAGIGTVIEAKSIGGSMSSVRVKLQDSATVVPALSGESLMVDDQVTLTNVRTKGPEWTDVITVASKER